MKNKKGQSGGTGGGGGAGVEGPGGTRASRDTPSLRQEGPQPKSFLDVGRKKSGKVRWCVKQERIGVEGVRLSVMGQRKREEVQ